MKLISISVIFSIFFSSVSFAKWGEGPLILSKEAMETAIQYMYGAGNKKYSGAAKRKNNPMIMAISDDGESWMYYYCPAEYTNGCVDTSITRKTISACEKYSNGSPCYIFAKKRKIVWKNGGDRLTIKKKDLKDPYIVAKKIKEAGFYDGDISKLVGIDVETGQINENSNITDEKERDKALNKVDNEDIVKKLQTLVKLFENGSLSKEEFQKAKDKLFQN